MGNSLERVETVLSEMEQPNIRSIPTLAREEGITSSTSYTYRNPARASGGLLSDNDNAPAAIPGQLRT